MRVHCNGEMDAFFQRGNQIKGHLGRHDACHVLNAHAVAAHAFQTLSQLHEALQIVDGADGVTQGALNVGPGADGRIYCRLHAARVVKGVKGADDIDAVFHCLGDKSPDDIIGIVFVAQQVLSPQQHL